MLVNPANPCDYTISIQWGRLHLSKPTAPQIFSFFVCVRLLYCSLDCSFCKILPLDFQFLGFVYFFQLHIIRPVMFNSFLSLPFKTLATQRDSMAASTAHLVCCEYTAAYKIRNEARKTVLKRHSRQT